MKNEYLFVDCLPAGSTQSTATEQTCLKTLFADNVCRRVLALQSLGHLSEVLAFVNSFYDVKFIFSVCYLTTPSTVKDFTSRVSLITEYMSMEYWWNNNKRGKPTYSEKNLSPGHFVHSMMSKILLSKKYTLRTIILPVRRREEGHNFQTDLPATQISIHWLLTTNKI